MTKLLPIFVDENIDMHCGTLKLDPDQPNHVYNDHEGVYYTGDEPVSNLLCHPDSFFLFLKRKK